MFIVFINDIDESVEGASLYKFADDTKMLRVVDSEEDQENMQINLENLMSWANSWQMQFNADKCKVIHFGTKNKGFHYTMGGHAPSGTV